jgi:hypothetical protein
VEVWTKGIEDGADYVGSGCRINRLLVGMAGDCTLDGCRIGCNAGNVGHNPPIAAWVPVSALLANTGNSIANPIANPIAISWMNVFVIFLKIGSVLYGTGYVLLAFLQTELVDRSHLLAGHAGAIAGTVGIFYPDFS